MNHTPSTSPDERPWESDPDFLARTLGQAAEVQAAMREQAVQRAADERYEAQREQDAQMDGGDYSHADDAASADRGLMLYRVMAFDRTSGTEGIFFAFFEVPDSEPTISQLNATAKRLLAVKWDADADDIDVFDVKSQAELHRDGIGSEHLPAWRWFEYGTCGGGATLRPSYIDPDAAVLLVDDVTAEMMRRAHAAALEHAHRVEMSLFTQRPGCPTDRRDAAVPALPAVEREIEALRRVAVSDESLLLRIPGWVEAAPFLFIGLMEDGSLKADLDFYEQARNQAGETDETTWDVDAWDRQKLHLEVQGPATRQTFGGLFRVCRALMNGMTVALPGGLVSREMHLTKAAGA